ncbi:MAG TPA: GNAT family N-acetyltransferase [Limnochordia bacterium]|nr:GNAT family N-acetyltransferase [Limnochordia bacterium]
MTTTSVHLRPLTKEDLAPRLAMINDEAVQRQTIGDRMEPTTQADLERWFEMVQADPFSEQWAVVTPAQGYVGDVDLHSIGVLGSEAWLSLMIGDPDLAEDAGFRRLVLERVVRYAFAEKGVAKVCVDLPSTDAVGAAALEALGFVRTDEMEMDVLTGVRTLTYELADRPGPQTQG